MLGLVAKGVACISKFVREAVYCTGPAGMGLVEQGGTSVAFTSLTHLECILELVCIQLPA